MNNNQKQNVKQLLITLVLLTSVVILSSSLPKLELKPGIQIEPIRENPNTSQPLDKVMTGLTTIENHKGLLFDMLSKGLFWILVPLLLILYLASPGNRKRRLAAAIFSALALATVPYLSYFLTKDVEAKALQPQIVMATPKPGVPELPPQLQPSPNLTLITFVIAVPVIFGIFILIWFYWLRYRTSEETARSIEKEAQNALTNLSQGEDLRNTIIKTYQQMSNILQQKHGITRKQAMTAREFSNELQRLNFPENAVKQLTELFEQVRYGNQKLGKIEENIAIQCLTEIVQAKEKHT